MSARNPAPDYGEMTAGQLAALAELGLVETEDLPDDVREQAALICAIAASNDPHDAFDAEIAVGGSLAQGVWLARDAFYASSARVRVRDRRREVLWAEAEALIRTGWSP